MKKSISCVFILSSPLFPFMQTLFISLQCNETNREIIV
jgi:hypothetical protein